VQLTRLATALCEANWNPVVCPSSLAFFFPSLVPTQQKRPRSAPSVGEIGGREDVPGEEERGLLSGDDAERTLSGSRVPMKVDGVVAESTVRRDPNTPKVGDFLSLASR